MKTSGEVARGFRDKMDVVEDKVKVGWEKYAENRRSRRRVKRGKKSVKSKEKWNWKRLFNNNIKVIIAVIKMSCDKWGNFIFFLFLKCWTKTSGYQSAQTILNLTLTIISTKSIKIIGSSSENNFFGLKKVVTTRFMDDLSVSFSCCFIQIENK